MVSDRTWRSRLELEQIYATTVVDDRDSACVPVRYGATVFRDQDVASILALDPLP